MRETVFEERAARESDGRGTVDLKVMRQENDFWDTMGTDTATGVMVGQARSGRAYREGLPRGRVRMSLFYREWPRRLIMCVVLIPSRNLRNLLQNSPCIWRAAGMHMIQLQFFLATRFRVSNVHSTSSNS